MVNKTIIAFRDEEVVVVNLGEDCNVVRHRRIVSIKPNRGL
jgi:hypothetical protein